MTEHMLKILAEKPPIYDECAKQFTMHPETVFAYGDTLYAPAGGHIPKDLAIHEATHCGQQEWSQEKAAAWWKRYLAEPEFRKDQEGEAYGKQYEAICAVVKDRNERVRQLHYLALQFSGVQYGNVVSYKEAYEIIKKRSHV